MYPTMSLREFGSQTLRNVFFYTSYMIIKAMPRLMKAEGVISGVFIPALMYEHFRQGWGLIKAEGVISGVCIPALM